MHELKTGLLKAPKRPFHPRVVCTRRAATSITFGVPCPMPERIVMRVRDQS